MQQQQLLTVRGNSNKLNLMKSFTEHPIVKLSQEDLLFQESSTGFCYILGVDKVEIRTS